MPNCFTSLFSWSRKRWIVAIGVAFLTYLFIALPTAVIENPIFGREIGVTSWSVTVIAISSILTGLLTATYVKNEYSCSLPFQKSLTSIGEKDASN